MLTATRFFSGASLTPSQEAAFFASLRLPNGTFKTTAHGRMDDLDAFVLACWRNAGYRPRELMDVAVSSGVTTLAWLRASEAAGLRVRMTATDLMLWAHLVAIEPGLAVLEAGGRPLQYVVGGLPVRAWRRRLDYVTGYALVAALVDRVAARRRARVPAEGRRVLLVSGEARDAPIDWVEDDIFADNPPHFVGHFDAIRAANILNRDYFDERQLVRAAANLKARLADPGARLIVNRTLADGTNNATLFRLAETGRLEVEARFGTGSEIEEIVRAA
jgi:hypothetical protein